MPAITEDELRDNTAEMLRSRKRLLAQGSPSCRSAGATRAARPNYRRCSDPFDRMLVAQALEERLVLITRDEMIRRHDVPTMPA